MSGYIGRKQAVTFSSVTLPIRKDKDQHLIEEDGSFRLIDGASLKDSNGNTIIHANGTIATVDFTPVETQLDSLSSNVNSISITIDSIEQDITSLDTSIGLLEDSLSSLSVDILTHKSTLTDNYVVEDDESALLMGPIKLPGTLEVSANAALTVFGEISVTGDLNISGTFSVR
jgi:hypothetical protein